MPVCRISTVVAILAALVVIPCDADQQVAAPQVRSNSDSAAVDDPAEPQVKKLESKNLPNPVQVTSKVISGGLPEGDAAFAELKAMGIKTVISVDGAKPDLAMAKKYGLRYVHLPHGYDSVPEVRGKELAKAVRDLPGPIYLHCHHGKHRSPAAAAVACVGAGMIDADEAALLLKIAGTGENYVGLFQSVAAAHPIDTRELNDLKVEYPVTAKLPAMAEAMVAIEHVHDHLKLIEKAGWKTPADHPALTPGHESLLLREHFTELLRTDDLKRRPEQFQQLTREAEALGLSLEESFKSTAVDGAMVSKKFAAVTANCKSCHQAFRDIPTRARKSAD